MSEIALFILAYLIWKGPFACGKNTLQGVLPSTLVNGKRGAKCSQSAIRNSINQDSEARTDSIYSITRMASYGGL